MWKCKKCGDYRLSTTKVCYCETFKILDEDGEEHEIQAMDKEAAALKYAEQSNTDSDYYLMNTTVIITVDGAKFEISAEPDVYYSANEI